MDREEAGRRPETVSASVHAAVHGPGTVLPRHFFERDPPHVARALLGKVLVRRISDGTSLSGRIVETEAYLGKGDAAAHSASGLTSRNAVLFGPAGHAYVYFTYGMHFCLNVSCLPPGTPGCVLFRALRPLEGSDAMARARNLGLPDPRLIASGPARLCQALSITRAALNGADLTAPASSLYLCDDGFRARRIRTSARIGITRSAALPLRFYLEKEPCVSRAR